MSEPKPRSAKTNSAPAKKPGVSIAKGASPPPPPPPPPPTAPAPPPPPVGQTPYPAADAAPAYPPVPLRPEDERNAAMLAHLISLLALLLSASWIPALIFYLVYKDRGAFVRAHTATELNFQLTIVIAIVAGFLLSLVVIGAFVIIAVPVLMIIFGIIATVKANQGAWYTYPIAIRFVR